MTIQVPLFSLAHGAFKRSFRLGKFAKLKVAVSNRMQTYPQIPVVHSALRVTQLLIMHGILKPSESFGKLAKFEVAVSDLMQAFAQVFVVY